MKLNKHYGRCVICGRKAVLTYEHIPPRKALNDSPTKVFNSLDVITNTNKLPWDFSGLKYNNSQRGQGKYTLCRECNNNTGSWYADDYSNFAIQMYNLLNGITIPIDKNVAVFCKDIYPLRILKQIVSMFLSVNENYELDDLQEFVLKKESQVFDKNKYRITMYINTGSMSRLLPKSAIFKSGGRHSPLENMTSINVSEISTLPLGFILYFGHGKETIVGTEITSFCDMSYDEKCDYQIPLVFKEVNSSLPLDFRTKEQIIQDRIKNQD